MDSTTRRLRSIMVIIVGLLPLFRGCHLPKHDVKKPPAGDVRVWTNPFPLSSPAHKEARLFNEWIQTNSELERLSNGADEIAKLELAGQLEAKGLGRLPTETLEQYLPLINKVLWSLDNKTCSEVAKGEISGSQLATHTVRVIETLSGAEAKIWFTTSESAIDAQLRNLPIIPVAKEDMQLAILKLAASLPDDRSKLLLSNLANIRTASDEDRCATVRTVFSQALLLPEPYRGYSTRSLFALKI